MRVLELRRILPSQLDGYEAAGWRPSVVREDGAVGCSPFSGGLGAEVLVVREITELPGAEDIDIVLDDSIPEGEIRLEGIRICIGDDRKPKEAE